MADPIPYRPALGLTALIAVAIAVLTLMPVDGVPGPSGMDKVYHFTAFAALVVPTVASRPRAALWAVPLAIAFGGAIEVIQPLVGRAAEWADLLANGLGAVAGAALGWSMHRLARRISHWG